MSKKKIVAVGAVRKAVGGVKVPTSSETASKTISPSLKSNTGLKSSTIHQ